MSVRSRTPTGGLLGTCPDVKTQIRCDEVVTTHGPVSLFREGRGLVPPDNFTHPPSSSSLFSILSLPVRTLRLHVVPTGVPTKESQSDRDRYRNLLWRSVSALRKDYSDLSPTSWTPRSGDGSRSQPSVPFYTYVRSGSSQSRPKLRGRHGNPSPPRGRHRDRHPTLTSMGECPDTSSVFLPGRVVSRFTDRGLPREGREETSRDPTSSTLTSTTTLWGPPRERFCPDRSAGSDMEFLRPLPLSLRPPRPLVLLESLRVWFPLLGRFLLRGFMGVLVGTQDLCLLKESTPVYLWTFVVPLSHPPAQDPTEPVGLRLVCSRR